MKFMRSSKSPSDMHTHKHNVSVEELYGETLSRHCESEIRNTKIHKISLLSSYKISFYGK